MKRKPEQTKVQSPSSKKYKTVAIPQSITRILNIQKESHALWIPLPLDDEGELARLIIFTTVDNPYDLQGELNRILELLRK